VAGIATATTDYTSRSGTLSFAPGTTSATITVTVVGDRTKEANETFQIVLSNASVGVTRGTATFTILTDESALTAAAAPTASVAAVPLRADQLERAIDQALASWRAAGASPATLAGLRFEIADLPETMLGMTDGATIYLDSDAAGFGWQRPATGMDLVSVLRHEIGHALGLDHDEDEGSLMAATLSAGDRLTIPAEVVSPGATTGGWAAPAAAGDVVRWSLGLAATDPARAQATRVAAWPSNDIGQSAAPATAAWLSVVASSAASVDGSPDAHAARSSSPATPPDGDAPAGAAAPADAGPPALEDGDQPMVTGANRLVGVDPTVEGLWWWETARRTAAARLGDPLRH